MSHIVWTSAGPQHNAPWLRVATPRETVRPTAAPRPSTRMRVAFILFSTVTLWSLIGAGLFALIR